MSRPILSLWRYLIGELVAIPALLCLALLLPLEGLPILCVLAIIILFLGWRSRWRWKLSLQALRFRTIAANEVVLHYSPRLDSLWNPNELLTLCQCELGWVAERLKISVRGRPAIFLFSSHQEIAKIFGSRYGGAALSLANAIVVAVDNFLSESLRHEFGHMFSERWNRSAPPLFREGLSVWLQDTFRNEPIDIVAWPWLNEPDLKLERLLNPSFFFSERRNEQCYILSGSFTGFLIKQFGWKTYRNLFQIKNTAGYRRRFQDCLGISLETAEKQWRKEVKAIGPLGRPL